MPIPFTCPHCGSQTNVDDRYAGQTGPCSHCGKSITIPFSSAAQAPPPRTGGGNALLWIAVVAGGGMIMLMIIGILIALLLPALQAARTAARRQQSMNNLKQINLALLNYESTYGTFPPAYIADENGKPMHSWRVLILPFMEQQALYKRYNFDEPWDGPSNRPFHNTVVPQYVDPASPNGPTSFTSYVAVTGANTLFPGAEAVALKDVVDGLSNTVSVVTTTDEDILWCEPRDLEYDQMSFQINDPEYSCISSDYPGGAPVGFADGSVRFVQDDMDSETLQGLLTRDDTAVDAPPE